MVSTYKKKQEDKKYFNEVLSNINIMNDATALESDTDLISLSTPGNGLSRRLRVVHVLGHVGVFPEERLQPNKRDFQSFSLVLKY